MIMKKGCLLLFSICLLYSKVVAVQEYCKTGYKPIADKPFELDLSKLNQDFIVYQNSSTPPTTKSFVTQINICDPLSITKEEEGECKKGDYVCQKVVYNRNGQDFIAEVHNIAGDFEKSKLDPEFKSIKPEEDSKNNGYQYSLVLSGGDNGSSALVTLECDTSQSRENKPSDPTVVSNHNNVLTLHWKTVFACTYDAGEKKPDQGNNGGENKGEQPETGKEGKSGVSIFFTIILILLAVYFVGGAIYNWKVYNARGLDLIPHRDFWLDLPYLIRDLIAHVIDSIMSRRRGSGGYVAV